ncbi:excinuclease ABC subunit UvrA, partial [Corynebacterium stationis]|uniref:excinuclease ABC subunit UvrA n=1 Tax=Corynebacterium stationis TaxID=1705 RepID=UPI002606FDCE
FGSCPACDGIGTKTEVDLDLLIPDKDAPAVDAIQPWTSSPNSKYFVKLVEGLGKALNFDPEAPLSSLSDAQRDALIYGSDEEVNVRYKNRYGRQRNWTAPFEGAVGFLERKLEQTDSEWAKDRLLQYTRLVPCPTCKGSRLRPEILAVRLAAQGFDELSIAGLTALSIEDASTFLNSLVLGHREEIIAGAVLKEIQARLRFLLDVGLNYLTLDRGASTLSGGEAQRIRLATQIGSGLAGVLYVLDEPSIGLHQRDNHRLIQTLKRLRDIGNTLIVVEHDEDTIRESDWLIDIGPRAGEYGGEVVYQGEPKGILKAKDSLTGQYLSGAKVLGIPDTLREIDKERMLKVVGAHENNLKDIDVEIPLGVLVCITGVSGSGKSTVVNQILAKTLANKLNRARQVPGRAVRVEGVEHLDKLVQVDQSPIGRTPRSNPATYTGVFDKIRNLFAETQEAKVRGYKAGRFSFNVKGGRCEACQGDGTIKIEMNFLPDVYVPCEVCDGARYNRETLEVLYKGKNIAEVLHMPISEAAEFFEPITSIHRYLATLVDVGLGYVRLGQAATTLSGGEAQRVKLASELQKRTNGRTIYILDEPTTGLHFEDIRKLMLVIQGLVDKGNSVIIIEHNLDVIKSADWIVDMGPEGGSGGGTVVAEGTPEDVIAVEGSYTGQYLKPLLEGQN